MDSETAEMHFKQIRAYGSPAITLTSILQAEWEALGWTFRSESDLLYFKSPRVQKEYGCHAFLEEATTLDSFAIRELEISALLSEKREELNKSFRVVAEDIINQYRLHLRRGLVPPETVTVSFDIQFQ